MIRLIRFICLILCVFCLNTISLTQAKQKNVNLDDVQQIPVICYHDVVEDNNTQALAKNPYTITKKRLEEHFILFKKYGYTPISLKQYDDYINNKGKLPDKPLILSFDDGNESMYTTIYPLLQKYNYPAIFAIILSYMDTVTPATDIEKMVSWEQLRQMEQSGLVTVGSHTYNLHNFVVANRYGDRQQNVSTIWWNEQNQYETESDFKARIENDMLMGKKVFAENMGHSTDILVYPFGVFTDYSVNLAKDMGYKYQLLLNDDKKLADKQLLSRFIIVGNPSDKEILSMLDHSYKKNNIIAGQIDIDMIYDSLPEQFERNIDATINKLYAMNVNTVFLQAFADEDGDGNVEEVYFYTNQLKVKADVFSHVTARLKSAGFQVYAWMPILCYPYMSENKDNAISASSEDKLGWYKRATPFSLQVQEMAKALVKDLALYAPIDGILFQDDLYMNDFEDFSPYAKAEFKKQFNKELTMENLASDEKLRDKWTKLKTDTINKLTLDLIAEAKLYRPELKTARNIYPIVISEPQAQEWFAQNYNDYLKLYDYVVIMAYPEMENEKNAKVWLEELVKTSLKDKQAEKKAIFKLQGYDWEKGTWISDAEQNDRINIIKSANGKNLAQYPVNVFDD